MGLNHDIRRKLLGFDRKLGLLWDVLLLAIFRKPKSGASLNRNRPPQRVLWIRVDRVGDLLVGTPLFRAFCSAYPDARQEILCSNLNRQVAESQPMLAEAIVFPKKSFWGALGLMIRLRLRRYDWVIDLNDSWSRTTALMSRAANPKIAWGAALPKHHDRARRFYDECIELPQRTHQAHLVELWAQQLGLPLENFVPTLPLPKERVEEAQRHIVEMGLEPKGNRNRPAVGFCMGNLKKLHDTYSLEESIALGRRLASRATVIPLWGPGEREEAQRLADGIGEDAAICPDLDILGLGAFMSQLDAVISPCTGPLHLAQAVRTPAVALCRSYTHAIWRPLEEPHISLIGDKGESVREIPAEEIIKAVGKLVGIDFQA